MSSVTDQVLQHLDASRVDAIAAQLGVDPAQAQSAIEQAVPLLVGGLARNASSDEGADALHTAVGAHAGVDIGSILGGMLGGSGVGNPAASGGGLGGAILGHIFGNRQDQAQEGLGQASGLGGQNAGQLLAMLAPIIMSVLGNMAQKKGLGPGGLGSALGQESQQIDQGSHGGLLGSILDRDGDGQLGLGDLLKAGSELLGSRGRV